MPRRVEDLIHRILAWVTGLLVVAIALLLMAQVLGRHVLHYPLPWPEEVAGFLFVWLIFLGAVRAYREGGLLGIDWLVAKLSPVGGRVVRLASDLIVIGLLAGLVWTGVEAAVAASGTRTTMLRFSWGWVYAAFPIGCAALLLSAGIAFARDAGELARLLRRRAPADAEDRR